MYDSLNLKLYFHVELALRINHTELAKFRICVCIHTEKQVEVVLSFPR